MRLIDADALLVNMNKGMQGTAREYLKFYSMAVNDEPTAYEVDKVVGQICGCDGCSNCCNCHEEEKMLECEEYARVYEIVKAGGVNE